MSSGVLYEAMLLVEDPDDQVCAKCQRLADNVRIGVALEADVSLPAKYWYVRNWILAPAV